MTIEFPGLDTLAGQIQDLRDSVEEISAQLDQLGSGLPLPLEERLGALEAALESITIDRIVKVPDEGMIFDAAEGHVRMLDRGTAKNEVEIFSKGRDGSAIRVQARHEVMGKVSFDFILPNGQRRELAMIQGRLGKVRRDSGEIAFFLNDGGGGEDANMKEAAILGFDEGGNIQWMVGNDPRQNHISYPPFSHPEVPDGVEPLPDGNPPPEGGTEPDGPVETQFINLARNGDWWEATGEQVSVELIKEVSGPVVVQVRRTGSGDPAPHVYVGIVGGPRIADAEQFDVKARSWEVPAEPGQRVRVAASGQNGGTIDIRDF